MSFTTDWPTKSPFSKLLSLALIIVLSVSILSLVAALLIIPLYGINIFIHPNLLSNYSDPAVIKALKVVQICNAIGMFIIPSIVIARLNSKDPVHYLRLDQIPSIQKTLLTIALMTFALPLINYLAEWNNSLDLPESLDKIEHWMRSAEDNAMRVTEAFLKMDTISDLLLNLFMIAFLAALGEELLFRGIVQPLMTDLSGNIHAGIWITALLFSAMHIQFFGFFPRMLLGAMFGYIYFHTGSLWIPMLAHFVNNGLAVILSYLIQHNIVSPEVDKLGTTEQTGMHVLTSLLMASICFYLICRTPKHNKILS